MDFATGLVYDPRYLDHDTGELLIRYSEKHAYDEVEPHPSGPVVTRRTHKLLDAMGYLGALTPIPPRLASRDDLLVVHSEEMIARVEAVSRTGGDTGFGAPIATGGEEIARLSVGGALAAVDAVLAGEVRNAFGLLRPPGHHATATESLGFCVYSNIAIAARHAQRTHGLGRIAILDWDVHHGNGTQDIFWHDPDVLFISIHQDNLFPLDWGKVEDCGHGDGLGATVNIPLPAGSGNAAYLAAMEELVLPIIRQFRPEMILASAGQDISAADPLGRMMVNVPAFRTMTHMMRDLADELCDGRLVILQEGGYSNSYAPYCAAAVVEGLMANPPVSIPDPHTPRAEVQPATQAVSLDQRAAIRAAYDVQRQWWSL